MRLLNYNQFFMKVVLRINLQKMSFIIHISLLGLMTENQTIFFSFLNVRNSQADFSLLMRIPIETQEKFNLDFLQKA